MTNGNVGNFIDAMRSQPLALALVAMNLGLLGFLYYDGSRAAQARHEEMELLYQNRTEMAKLLYSCTPVEHK
jgi:hypothetical protein